MDLNKVMEFDHVICVALDGTVTDADGMHAPEIYIEYSGPFTDAQISDDQERDMIAYVKAQGWDVLAGWAMGGGLALMHSSQFIGGNLADHIRETPGHWVACPVELHPDADDPEHEDNGGTGETDPAGWILAHRAVVRLGSTVDSPAGPGVVTDRDTADGAALVTLESGDMLDTTHGRWFAEGDLIVTGYNADAMVWRGLRHVRAGEL